MPQTVKSLRRDALSILRFCIKACDPFHAIRKRIKLKQGKLWVDHLSYDLKSFQRILIIGAGKASARMTFVLEEILGEKISSGIVITKRGYLVPLNKVELVEGGHPLPDKSGWQGTRRIARLLSRTTADDLIIFLLSGGGSSLLVSPVPGIGLRDKIGLTDQLLRCGADIKEINTIRKHISQVKGGKIAQLAQPAKVLTLILSDVIGDKIEFIASGPTAPDSTTFSGCLKIIQKYELADKIPPSIYLHLKKGEQGKIEETPKPGDRIFKRVRNVIIGSNRIALQAAKRKAEALGYNTLVLPRPVAGDTTRAALRHVDLVRQIKTQKNPVSPPACVISGGETTVKIKGKGLGGRNQEFALVSAMGIDGMKDVVFLSAGTDGTDGPTDAAGAICDGDTIKRALKKGMDPTRYLKENDSYHFFGKLGDLIITGPTHTNVMDIHLILIGK
ncbi:MAG: glycerate kinase [candidate division Zixibacteria bacterium]|nr:glycerate kinase [candidate division Zixibacteria bacterium]